MALSSLQAQLAALNNPKQAGLSIPSNKRHDDAAGRGLHYSVHHGQAVADKAVQYKATLLHASARDAADIPLKVLEEKCKDALNQLDLDDWVPVVCDREASPTDVKSTLLHLTCLLPESPEECLQVLEFMIRKYNLHSNFSAELVWTLLPHADTMWLYFHRCLQMVDLAADQSYFWLRPYVTADTGSVKKIPQSLLAQHIFKNASWLTRLMELVQFVKGEPDHYVLSWSVNIMFKGFAWLARDVKTDKEAVIRTIFPYLMASFGSSVRRMWGYVIVSSMAEHMNLANDTVDLLIRKILNHVETGLEPQSDAIMTILGILVPPRQQLIVEESCYLPLIGRDKWLGCPLSEATHTELMAVDWLAVVLGHLHHNRRVLVSPLVAALFVRSLAQNQTVAIIKLVREAKLLALWRDKRYNLVASVSSAIVGKGILSDGASIKVLRQVLKCFYEIDGSSCHKGIAHSFSSHSNLIRDDKQKFIQLIEGIDSFDETLAADTDDFHDILSRQASKHANLDGSVDEESGKEDDGAKNEPVDDVDTIIQTWAQSKDAALAKAAFQLQVDKDALENLRLAVILECATRPETQSRDVVKLVSYAVSALDCMKHLHCGFLPGLALLQHSKAQVREAAIDLLEGIGQRLGDKRKWSVISSICRGLKTKNVTIKMGGHVLPDLFVSCLAGNQEGGKIMERLLEMCVCSAACVVDEVPKIGPDIFTKSWLPVSAATGSAAVASVILDSLELMGEDICPLSARWRNAGHCLLNGLLKHGSTVGPSITLIRPLIKMLKGVKVLDPHIIVSSGPNSRGGRTRSYSVGKMDGLAVIQPYPAEMRKMIILILEESAKTPMHEIAASLVISDLVMSATWRNGVFSKFSSRDQRSVACAIMSYAARSIEEDILQAFTTLPLDISDVCMMLKDDSDANMDIRITFLSEFVYQNASHIWTSHQGIELLSNLFNVLLTVSLVADNVEGHEVTFIQQSILAAIEELLVTRPSSEQEFDGRNTDVWLTSILSLLSNTDSPNRALYFFKKMRLRSSAFSIASRMIKELSKDVAAPLNNVLCTAVQLSCGNCSSYTQHARQTFEFLVPLYKKYGSLQGISIEHLFTSFIQISFETQDIQQFRLFQDLAHVLEEDNHGSRDVAGLLCLYLAYRSHEQKFDSPESVRNAVQVLASMTKDTQIASLLTTLDYISDILSFLTHPAMSSKAAGAGALFDITCDDLLGATLKGFNHKGNDQSLHSLDTAQTGHLIRLAKSLLDTFGDCLLLDGVKLYFRRSGDAAGKCLEIWQKLLEIHATTRNKLQAKDTSIQQFLKYAVDSLDQSRGTIQTLLPVHIFLASISSIIIEGKTADVRSNALHLVADRVASVTPSSPEALLFVDLVPEITKILKSKTKGLSDHAALSESALIALEQTCVVIRTSDALREESIKVFVDALAQVSEQLNTLQDVPSLDSLGSNERQLMCSLVLCSGSIIRSVGVAVVAILPKLVQSIVSILSSAEAYSGKFEEEIQILRLSIVKTLTAIVESVPQLLAPHLDSILTEKAVLSGSLRNDSPEKLDSLRSAVERLDLVFANSVPCRILIPALCRSVTACSTIAGTRAVMIILEKVLNEVSSVEASVQRNILLKTVMSACDVRGAFGERLSLVSVCETVLLSLVMKLSEGQLRRVFVSLREWSSLDTSRKFSFWTFSKALSQKLKGIFLPLLSAVFSDAVGELNLTCESTAVARSKSKKRRLNDDKSKSINVIDADSTRFLDPLLMCLETALRTDARGGGSWIRSDEDNRYHALLLPLGSLLEGHLSAEVSQTSTRSAYHQLVHGTGDESGSVIGCITALAAAAGNEQLWKPLNHAVLSACANEDRADVRKAGLECLLSLMRSLGEEYMVLLPECLPTLSEALEDSMEDNAIIAREIVSVAEELIGESLQESLR